MPLAWLVPRSPEERRRLPMPNHDTRDTPARAPTDRRHSHPRRRVRRRPTVQAVCRGGHGVSAYEQNTQQSPANGSKRVPHPLHS